MSQSAEGQEALNWLLTNCGHRVKIFYANKKFATACKFFEYVFEPVLTDNSLLFYKHNFHRFIANLLYIGMLARDQQADELLADLQKMIKSQDATGLNRLFSIPLNLPSEEVSAINDIISFAVGYRNRILGEVSKLNELGDQMVWMMDLSTTALCSIVRSFAKDTPQLTVICDESKPLRVSSEVIEAIVQANFFELQEEMGWEKDGQAQLQAPLTLVRSSENTPGIQLADLFAGMARRVITSPDDDLSKKWKAGISPLFIAESVYADVNYIDLEFPEVSANAVVLRELALRARSGADPLRGMHVFYAHLKC